MGCPAPVPASCGLLSIWHDCPVGCPVYLPVGCPVHLPARLAPMPAMPGRSTSLPLFSHHPHILSPPPVPTNQRENDVSLALYSLHSPGTIHYSHLSSPLSLPPRPPDVIISIAHTVGAYMSLMNARNEVKNVCVCVCVCGWVGVGKRERGRGVGRSSTAVKYADV